MQLFDAASVVTTINPPSPSTTSVVTRLGSWAGGEPAWDRAFDSADFFVLLPVESLVPRYAQHFLGARVMQ